MPTSETKSRLQFLDWLRGFGAVIMLQGHTYHSLLRDDLRKSSTFILSDFLGGMPSAVFLFLSGVTLAFLMDSHERKNSPARTRVLASLRRAGYILALAFLVLIGVALVADGFKFHIPRGYIYFAITFSAAVEFFNVLAKRNRKKAVS